MFNVGAFLKTLPVMLEGLLGIFIVTAIIIVSMVLLNSLTKDKKDKKQ